MICQARGSAVQTLTTPTRPQPRENSHERTRPPWHVPRGAPTCASLRRSQGGEDGSPSVRRPWQRCPLCGQPAGDPPDLVVRLMAEVQALNRMQRSHSTPESRTAGLSPATGVGRRITPKSPPFADSTMTLPEHTWAPRADAAATDDCADAENLNLSSASIFPFRSNWKQRP